jgi:hypothetical protein
MDVPRGKVLLPISTHILHTPIFESLESVEQSAKEAKSRKRQPRVQSSINKYALNS